METMAAAKPERLTGRLIKIFESGYGFLHVGPGKPDHFIHCKDVDAADWVIGTRFTFISQPASGKRKCPRAGRPVAVKSRTSNREGAGDGERKTA